MNGPAAAARIATVGLLLLVGLPIGFVVLQAVFPGIGAGSLAAPFSRLPAVLADRGLATMTWHTLLLGSGVVLGAAALALPLGACRALFRVPLAGLWDIAFLVPFMIPPYIATLGWILTLQPRGYLQQFTGAQAGALLFSPVGIALVMSLNTFPVVYFAVSRILQAVGGRLADVARVFGASPWVAFRRITLPLVAPGLAASLLLVFAMAIEEYGTVAALGRAGGFEVLVTGIDGRLSDWPIDLPGAATLSLVLVLLSLAAFTAQLRLLGRRGFATTGGKPQPLVQRRLGPWAVPVLAGFALVAATATGVPLLAILATALSRTLSGGLTPGNLGLQNFAAILDQGSTAMEALGNSLALGVGTALVTGVLGAVASYAVVRGTGRGVALLDALTVLPNAMPGVVVALGLILAWNQPILPLSPYGTPLILLIAYCCILLPFPVRYANAAFRQIEPNLEAASRISGASAAIAFRRILMPLAAPSLVAAMLLVFAVASRELVASLLLAPAGMPTLATFIWEQFEQGSVGLGMAMAFVAIVVTTLLPLPVLLLLRRGKAEPP